MDGDIAVSSRIKKLVIDFNVLDFTRQPHLHGVLSRFTMHSKGMAVMVLTSVVTVCPSPLICTVGVPETELSSRLPADPFEKQS